MSEAIAVTTGALAMALVLALGVATRPRTSRQRSSARPDDDDRARAPRSRRSPWFIAAFLVGGGIALVGPAPLVIIGAGVLVVRRHRRSVRRRRHRQAIEAALPDAVELLVLCIRAGCSPTQAVRELVARAPPPLRPAFAAVDLSLHRGRSLADALGSLGDHAGPLGRDIARAIATADRDGLPLAPVLDRLAADARTARRRLGEAAARRLPVRLTFPLVTCTLPSFVLLAIAPAVLGALSTLRDRTP
jgi:Flp pilus assembly protein TadB